MNSLPTGDADSGALAKAIGTQILYLWAATNILAFPGSRSASKTFSLKEDLDYMARPGTLSRKWPREKPG